MNTRDRLLQVQLRRDGAVSRRRWLQMSATACAGSGLLGQVSRGAEKLKSEGRACILVWLAGGPSHFELWDPKPDHANGGATKAISTAAPGVKIAEHWPNIAKEMNDVAVIRSMTNKEGSHERATYQLHTGRTPTGALKFPNIGSVVASQLGNPASEIPNFVSIGTTLGSGFLGVQAQPFVVTAAGQLPENVANLVDDPRLDRRLSLLLEQDKDFARAGALALAKEHNGLYKQATRMMRSAKLKAFQIDEEPEDVAAKYGATQVGKGLLVARRLVEQGVPFIEVRQGGWDNHVDIFKRLPANAAQVDQGLAALIQDLRGRGMLERTLVICMGEFGRTPKINPRGGRDHYPKAFGVAMAGSGIRGGQAIGKTTEDGAEVDERPCSVPDLFQSICHALDLSGETEIYTPAERPIKIVDGGERIGELFG